MHSKRELLFFGTADVYGANANEVLLGKVNVYACELSS
jgi:aryl-alcohol dehydrogenase-like predicted oxidoreductase